jgi:hypothetical protein
MNVKYCSIMSYCIYKIVCDDLPEYIYVGSTKAFRSRKNQHKSRCNKGCTEKLYSTIRENGGWNNWRMVMIEECGEISLVQVRIKEEENRMKLNANMNTLRCYVTEEEKKERIKEYGKEYYEANKEHIKQYYQTNKEYQQQYYQTNKEHIIEHIKQYREANKEHIKEYEKQKITCECGKTFKIGEKSRHSKSNVHTNFINNKII